MILNDPTNFNGLLQRAEHYTNLGLGAITTGNPNLKKQFINHINVAQHDLFMICLEAQDAWDVDDHKHSKLKIFTTPLTTNRSYTFDITNRILEWERVDVSYDGDTYSRAQPIDADELGFGFGNDADIDSNFTKTRPAYELMGDSLLLYPMASQEDVDRGGEIRMEWSREANEFAFNDTDDDKEAFIIRPFHEQIAIRAAYKWLMVNKPDNESLLTRLEREIGRGTKAIQEYYGSREADRKYQITPATRLTDFT